MALARGYLEPYLVLDIRSAEQLVYQMKSMVCHMTVVLWVVFQQQQHVDVFLIQSSFWSLYAGHLYGLLFCFAPSAFGGLPGLCGHSSYRLQIRTMKKWRSSLKKLMTNMNLKRSENDHDGGLFV
jgi:hypothetical protein